jgi:hypothetical protein
MKKESFVNFILVAAMIACSDGPEKTGETMTPEAEKAVQSIIDNSALKGSASKEEHRVVINEILESDSYSYVKVSEGEDEYWIATIKGTYTLDEIYTYNNGLYKTDYFSTEFNRSFDRIYLVSNLKPINSAEPAAPSINKLVDIEPKSPISAADYEREGSIKIKDLVADADKYANKQIQITAKVVKVNSAIMNRNWLHLKDGSFDDFDLVATTQEGIPSGDIVTIKGMLVLNRDFGAGYSYDLIVENATLVP